MKTNLYINNKKTTRKAVKELVGDERLKKMITESKEAFMNDPFEENSYFIGSGMLTIEFC